MPNKFGEECSGKSRLCTEQHKKTRPITLLRIKNTDNLFFRAQRLADQLIRLALVQATLDALDHFDLVF